MEAADLGRTEKTLAVRRLAGRELRRKRLPLTEVLIDQPVDDVRDVLVDSRRRVADDALFELALDARLVQEIEDTADAQRVLEVVVAARLHLEQHLLDAGHPELEPARQVIAVRRKLPLDVVERRHVVAEQPQPFVGDRFDIAARACPRRRCGFDSFKWNRLLSSRVS